MNLKTKTKITTTTTAKKKLCNSLNNHPNGNSISRGAHASLLCLLDYCFDVIAVCFLLFVIFFLGLLMRCFSLFFSIVICLAYWISLGIWYSPRAYTQKSTRQSTQYTIHLHNTTERSVGTVRQHVEWSRVLKRLKCFVHGALLLYAICFCVLYACNKRVM